MIRKYLVPILAVFGVVIAIVAVIADNQPVSPDRPAVPSPKPPFASYVAGTGIVEPSSGNILVGTPVAGIVTAIDVNWGDHVAAGDKLFQIDDRDLQAQILPAVAGVKEAEAALAQTTTQLQMAEKVPDKRAISAEEMNNRRSAVAVHDAGLARAHAQVDQIKLEIERRTVRASQPGQILQINIRPGEFAQSGELTTPLMVLGTDARLYLRVSIDQYDAWRIRPGAPGMGYVRGNPTLQTPLRFERIEPYVVPKTALTGLSTEQTDTRVLHVIYSFDPATLPGAYVGLQMDAFVQAQAQAPAASPGSPP